MGNNPKTDAPIDEFMREPLDRRLLLKRTAALGFSIPVMAGLLAACGGDDDEPEDAGSDATSPPAAEDATPEAEADPTEAPEGAATAAPEDEPTEAPEEEETPADSGSSDQPAGEGVYGGKLRVALIGEPPTLDIHFSTTVVVGQIVWHIYESLFTWDEEFAIIPLLAESFEVSQDGLLNSVKLREGVLFHNGEELKAADVIASFERWAAVNGFGAAVAAATDEIVEVDDYSIDFKMSSPLGTFTVLMARQNGGFAIYPKSVVEAAGEGPLTEFIGTGRYKFTEQQTDRYILFSRFDDYVGREGDPNGYGGVKAAYLDEIEFVPVPDEAARIAGMQAGDYHYLQDISPDQFAALEDDPNVVAETLPPTGFDVLVLNTKQSVTADLKIRQAFLAALDCQSIAQAALGEGYYRLDPGFSLQETIWHTTVGEEYYNQGDPEKARQLLEEAGYDGTPLRILTSQEYQDQYNKTVVAKQQLEEVGFTVELAVSDWATVSTNRAIEDKWEVFTTWFSFRPDPTMQSAFTSCEWPGWWCTDDKVEVSERLQRESDFDTRFEAYKELQLLCYTEAPIVKIADRVGIMIRSPRLHGLESTLFQLQPDFSNVWLEEA